MGDMRDDRLDGWHRQVPGHQRVVLRLHVGAAGAHQGRDGGHARTALLEAERLEIHPPRLPLERIL